MIELILASSSPSRMRLLESAGIKPTVLVSGVDEEGEEFLVEPGTDSENLIYLLELIKRADNRFNREEIKEMRTFLKLKLY